MKQRKPILAIIIVAFMTLLLALNVYQYFYFTPKISEMAMEKAVLDSKLSEQTLKITEHTQTITVLQDDLKNTRVELNNALAQVSAKSDEFTGYKDLLRKYVLSSKSIQEDLQAISATLNKKYSSNAELEAILDEFESELETFKRHSVTYKQLLQENKEEFTMIAIDVNKEVEDIDTVIAYYEDLLGEYR